MFGVVQSGQERVLFGVELKRQSNSSVEDLVVVER